MQNKVFINNFTTSFVFGQSTLLYLKVYMNKTFDPFSTVTVAALSGSWGSKKNSMV
jgi:hypothetical protein